MKKTLFSTLCLLTLLSCQTQSEPKKDYLNAYKTKNYIWYKNKILSKKIYLGEHLDTVLPKVKDKDLEVKLQDNMPEVKYFVSSTRLFGYDSDALFRFGFDYLVYVKYMIVVHDEAYNSVYSKIERILSKKYGPYRLDASHEKQWVIAETYSVTLGKFIHTGNEPYDAITVTYREHRVTSKIIERARQDLEKKEEIDTVLDLAYNPHNQ